MSFLGLHGGRVHHMAKSLQGIGTGGNGMTPLASQWDMMGQGESEATRNQSTVPAPHAL